MMLYLGDIIPTSTLDWHGRVVMTIFFRGCPFKCPYCSNAQLIEAEAGEPWEIGQVCAEISRASDFIDGIVVSGGEPFMQPAALEEIARHAKGMGLLVGAQTNGMYPGRMAAMAGAGLLDAVMLDVKAPLEAAAYSRAAGDRDRRDIHEAVTAAVDLCNRLRAEGRIIYFEARTTVFHGLSDRPEDIGDIVSRLRCDTYVLQQGRPEIAMDDTIKKLEAVPRGELLELAKHARRTAGTDSVKVVKVRTREMGDEIVL
jgi:pyruvate formate lyase activating enzyme